MRMQPRQPSCSRRLTALATAAATTTSTSTSTSAIAIPRKMIAIISAAAGARHVSAWARASTLSFQKTLIRQLSRPETRALRYSIASLPRSFNTAASSQGQLQHDVSDEEIAALTRQKRHSLSLADLVKHGRPPLSEESLLSSANFTLSLLPIRLAHRIQALRNLPYIVVSNPNISRIYNTYLHSLSILLPYWRAAAAASPRPLDDGRAIATTADEVHFTDALAELVATHTDTIPILAKGFLECRRYISPADVTRFLDEHLRARIGTRLIAEQHIALHYSSQVHAGQTKDSPPLPPPTYIGAIDTALRPAQTVESCAGFVADICELRYGSRPELVIDGEPDTTFAFVPMHLEYIVTELLKNAFRASVESRTREPVVVTIAPEPPLRHHQPSSIPEAMTPPSTTMSDADAADASRSASIAPLDDNAPGVTIRIRDRGGGIPPEVLPNIWSYSFTTFSEHDDGDIYSSSSSPSPSGPSGGNGLSAITSGAAGGSSIAGLGYGLPLSQAYAGYFGGGIAVQSLYGWGTDVYLRLKGVGKIAQ